MPISAGGMDDEAMPIEEVVEDDFQTGSDVIGLEEVSAKAHRKALVRHAAYLLADVLALFVHRPPSPAHRAELLPGVHALLSMCTTVELQECHAGSDGTAKRALQALRETHEATRFKGKV